MKTFFFWKTSQVTLFITAFSLNTYKHLEKIVLFSFTYIPFSDHCFIILDSCFINLMYQKSISKKRCQLQLSERSSLWEVTSGLKRSKNGVKSFLNKHLDKKRSKELLFSETISFHTAERSRKHFLRNIIGNSVICLYLGVLRSTN